MIDFNSHLISHSAEISLLSSNIEQRSVLFIESIDMRIWELTKLENKFSNTNTRDLIESFVFILVEKKPKN